jgi:hypothetical protein
MSIPNTKSGPKEVGLDRFHFTMIMGMSLSLHQVSVYVMIKIQDGSYNHGTKINKLIEFTCHGQVCVIIGELKSKLHEKCFNIRLYRKKLRNN